MALAYLAAWKGPVLAADDPYGDGITDTSLGAVRHLQEARMIEEKDLNKIKSMIMRYGGVESSLYMSIQNAWDSSEDYEPMTASYYYAGNERPNHDIVIVGWDDDYSRENFNTCRRMTALLYAGTVGEKILATPDIFMCLMRTAIWEQATSFIPDWMKRMIIG